MTPEHVGVDVDEPRRHIEARGVRDFAGALARDVRGDQRHFAPGDSDIGNGVDAVAGIDDVPALDQEIEFTVLGGEGGTGNDRQRSQGEGSTSHRVAP